jgi:putative ubiquitin-RnfH superfamily antitoxin RatB of RatAB toxin-antitoxin module
VTLRVCVVLALPERQEVVELDLQEGATVADAVAASGLAERYPALEVARMPAGIWSRPRPPETLLRDGDRVELYRPLQADPKAQRRVRAGARPSSTRSRSGR